MNAVNPAAQAVDQDPRNTVALVMLKKAQDADEQQSAQLLQAIPPQASSGQGGNMPYQGQNVDVAA